MLGRDLKKYNLLALYLFFYLHIQNINDSINMIDKYYLILHSPDTTRVRGHFKKSFIFKFV